MHLRPAPDADEETISKLLGEDSLPVWLDTIPPQINGMRATLSGGENCTMSPGDTTELVLEWSEPLHNYRRESVHFESQPSRSFSR